MSSPPLSSTTEPATAVSPFPQLRADLQAALLGGYDELIGRLSWDREQIRAHQRERLRRLLRHAAARSPFHAERLAGLDVESVDPGDLSGLPVMTKADLMGSFDRVVTDPRITLARVEAALHEVMDEPAVPADSVLATVSGGSSGVRGVFVQDIPAARQSVGSLSRGMMARIRTAGAPPGGLRVAMVAAGSPVHPTGAAPALTGGALPFGFRSVPVTLPLREIVERLDRMQPHALYGYPTMLARLAAEQAAGRLGISPLMVTTTAETLTEELRRAIREGFGAPVVDSFGTAEGLIGGSPPDDDVLVFAEDGCIVELVDADDRPVPAGTPSAAVLVTVLENRLQPLIRYRLTDSFVEQPPVPGHGYLRARVEGRADDVLRFGDVPVHPLAIRTVMVHTPAVVDYRVRQTASGIAVSAVGSGDIDSEGLRDRLVAALSQAGVPGPEVDVEVVPELPLDPDSGKLRRFAPLR